MRGLYVEAYEDALFLNNLLGRNYRMFDSNFHFFTGEELSTITEVTITGASDLSLLQYLPNLTKLTIKSEDYNKVGETGSYEPPFFNKISTLELKAAFAFLPKLKDFSLINDLNITELDFTGLNDLRNVTIENNPELKSIKGMGDLHKLEKVIIYGNNIRYFEDFTHYLLNTIDAYVNIVDIGVFFSACKDFDEEDLKKLVEAKMMGLIEVDFAEKNGLCKYTKLTLEQVVDLYIKFKRLFKQKGLTNASDIEKIAYSLNYIINYFQYAGEEVKNREGFIEEVKERTGGIPDWSTKHLAYLHSSYVTYMRKRGNCEGLVNLMRFMLGTCEVMTEDVQCNDYRSKQVSTTNHAILRANIDGIWRYFDMSYDIKKRKNYAFMTYDEVSKYLELSLYEKNKVKEGTNYEQKSPLPVYN